MSHNSVLFFLLLFCFIMLTFIDNVVSFRLRWWKRRRMHSKMQRSYNNRVVSSCNKKEMKKREIARNWWQKVKGRIRWIRINEIDEPTQKIHELMQPICGFPNDKFKKERTHDFFMFYFCFFILSNARHILWASSDCFLGIVMPFFFCCSPHSDY